MGDNSRQRPGVRIDRPHPAARRIPGKIQRRRRNRRRVLSGAIALVLLAGIYTVAGRLGVPWLFQTVALERLQQSTGLRMAAETFHFDPWSFTLHAEGLTFAEPDQAPLLSIRHFRARLVPLALLRAEWVCRSVIISGAEADLRRRENGRYNIEAMLHTWRSSSDYEIMDFSELPFYFSLNNIRIDHSRLLFSDLPGGSVHSIDDITLHLPTLANFNAGISPQLAPAFSAVIDDTPVAVASHGSGVKSTLSTTVPDLDLTRYARFIPDEFPFTVKNGHLHGTIQLAFHSPRSNERTLRLSWKLVLTHPALVFRRGKGEITADRAALAGEYNSVTNTLTMKSAVVEKPRAVVPMPAGEVSLTHLLRRMPGSGGEGRVEVIPETSVFTLKLRRLSLQEGELLLRSETDTEGWHHINLTGENLLADTRHPENAPAAASGNVSLSAERMALTVGRDGSRSTFRFTLQGLLEPWHRRGVPRLHEGWFSARNLHGFHDIGRSFGLQTIAGDALALSAAHLSAGPIDTRHHPLQLGQVNLTGGHLRLIPARLPNPWLFALALPSPIACEGFHYEGDLSLQLQHHGEALKWHFSPFTVETKREEKREGTGSNRLWWRAVVADDRTPLEAAALEGRGSLSLHPFALQNHINFKDLRLGQELSFLTSRRKSGTPTLLGRLAGSGELTLPQFSWKGRLFVSDGSLHTAEGAPLLSWKKLAADGINYFRTITGAESFAVGDVHLYQPRITLPLTTSPPAAFASLRTAMLHALPGALHSVESLTIDNGSLHLDDHRITPPWHGTLEQLKATVRPFYSAAGSDFSLKGSLAGGEITANGSADFNAPLQDARVNLTASAVPLAPFIPQLEKDGLLDGRMGTASVQLNTLWLAGSASSRGEITLQGLTALKPRSNIAAALALLHARGEGLRLSLDSSATQTGKPLFTLILNRLQRALLRGVVAPLRETKLPEIATRPPIPFAPGSSSLSETGRSLLRNYARLLQQNGALRLELEPVFGSDPDARALNLNEKGSRLSAQGERQLKELAKERAAAVAVFLREQSKSTKASLETEQFLLLPPVEGVAAQVQIHLSNRRTDKP